MRQATEQAGADRDATNRDKVENAAQLDSHNSLVQTVQRRYVRSTGLNLTGGAVHLAPRVMRLATDRLPLLTVLQRRWGPGGADLWTGDRPELRYIRRAVTPTPAFGADPLTAFASPRPARVVLTEQSSGLPQPTRLQPSAPSSAAQPSAVSPVTPNATTANSHAVVNPVHPETAVGPCSISSAGNQALQTKVAPAQPALAGSAKLADRGGSLIQQMSAPVPASRAGELGLAIVQRYLHGPVNRTAQGQTPSSSIALAVLGRTSPVQRQQPEVTFAEAAIGADNPSALPTASLPPTSSALSSVPPINRQSSTFAADASQTVVRTVPVRQRSENTAHIGQPVGPTATIGAARRSITADAELSVGTEAPLGEMAVQRASQEMTSGTPPSIGGGVHQYGQPVVSAKSQNVPGKAMAPATAQRASTGERSLSTPLAAVGLGRAIVQRHMGAPLSAANNSPVATTMPLPVKQRSGDQSPQHKGVQRSPLANEMPVADATPSVAQSEAPTASSLPVIRASGETAAPIMQRHLRQRTEHTGDHPVTTVTQGMPVTSTGQGAPSVVVENSALDREMLQERLALPISRSVATAVSLLVPTGRALPTVKQATGDRQRLQSMEQTASAEGRNGAGAVSEDRGFTATRGAQFGTALIHRHLRHSGDQTNQRTGVGLNAMHLAQTGETVAMRLGENARITRQATAQALVTPIDAWVQLSLPERASGQDVGTEQRYLGDAADAGMTLAATPLVRTQPGEQTSTQPGLQAEPDLPIIVKTVGPQAQTFAQPQLQAKQTAATTRAMASKAPADVQTVSIPSARVRTQSYLLGAALVQRYTAGRGSRLMQPEFFAAAQPDLLRSASGFTAGAMNNSSGEPSALAAPTVQPELSLMRQTSHGQRVTSNGNNHVIQAQATALPMAFSMPIQRAARESPTARSETAAPAAIPPPAVEPAANAGPNQIDIERLADQVYAIIERRLIIERESMGL